jgi:hypothetical protein
MNKHTSGFFLFGYNVIVMNSKITHLAKIWNADAPPRIIISPDSSPWFDPLKKYASGGFKMESNRRLVRVNVREIK